MMRSTTARALLARFIAANERIASSLTDDEVEYNRLWWHDERASHGHAPELRFDVSVIFDGALDEEFTLCTNSADEVLKAIADDCLKCYRDGDQSHEAGFTVELHRLDPIASDEHMYTEPYLVARYEHGRLGYVVV